MLPERVHVADIVLATLNTALCITLLFQHHVVGFVCVLEKSLVPTAI